MTPTTLRCKCGHKQEDHIYGVGSCRSGIVCPCSAFTPSHSEQAAGGEEEIKYTNGKSVDQNWAEPVIKAEPVSPHRELAEDGCDIGRPMTEGEAAIAKYLGKFLDSDRELEGIVSGVYNIMTGEDTEGFTGMKRWDILNDFIRTQFPKFAAKEVEAARREWEKAEPQENKQ